MGGGERGNRKCYAAARYPAPPKVQTFLSDLWPLKSREGLRDGLNLLKGLPSWREKSCSRCHKSYMAPPRYRGRLCSNCGGGFL